jgi:hypothetical protein
MIIRINKWDNEEHQDKLLSRYELKESDISETFKILYFMKQNEIPLKVYKEDASIFSDDYEEYFIEEVNMVFDSDTEGIIPHISISCE